ncbi:MAG: hypothetical protein H0W50_10615 [Parachlamydiaceae bacterium]|nr:hypothetical protein [Parachlamydiaceae bacterium]
MHGSVRAQYFQVHKDVVYYLEIALMGIPFGRALAKNGALRLNFLRFLQNETGGLTVSYKEP